MGEWKESTWGEQVSLEYGKALRGYSTDNGKYRVYGSNGPIGWTSEPLVPGPGVILGRKGAYRGVEYSRQPFHVIDTAYYVVPKNEMDMRWLYYAIIHHELGKVDDGSPIPSTTRSAVYVMDMDVPPLPEQRAIAHILGALDDKIELNRRTNETLEAIARALFKSWFIDFDPVRRNAARARNQPSPQAPLPVGEGGLHYRAGYDFAGLAEVARGLRKRQTPAEDIFWAMVRDRQFLGLKFRRQHQLGDYIADFFCHDLRLIVELDGGVHMTKEAKDHKRDAWMRNQGYTVLRFQNEQIIDDPASVLSAIAALRLPSPAGRGAGGEGVVEEFDHLFPDSFVDSDLGKIPKGWRVGVMNEILAVSRDAISPQLSSDSTFDHYSLPAFDKGRRPAAELGSSIKSSKYPVPKNAILLSKLNPHIPRVWLASPDSGRCAVCSTEFLVCTPRRVVRQEFIYCLLSSPGFLCKFASLVTGTTGSHQRVKPEAFLKMEAVIPNKATSEAFHRLVAHHLKLLAANIAEQAELATTRDALLPKLLSGEIRIKDAEKFVEDVA